MDDLGYYLDGIPYLLNEEGRTYLLHTQPTSPLVEIKDCEDAPLVKKFFQYTLLDENDSLDSFDIYVNGTKLTGESKCFGNIYNLYDCLGLGRVTNFDFKLTDQIKDEDITYPYLQYLPVNILEDVMKLNSKTDRELLQMLSLPGNIRPAVLEVLNKRNNDPEYKPQIIYEHYDMKSRKNSWGINFATVPVPEGNLLEKFLTISEIAPVKIKMQFDCLDLDKLAHRKIHTVELYEMKSNQTHLLSELNSSDLHTLEIVMSNDIRDVSTLGRFHTLNLEGCEGVTDVSKLGGVHTLNLDGCVNVTDVNELGNVYDLNLSGCDGVSDVSELGNVHTLNLSYTGVTDVSKLGGVHTLTLTGCRGVTDVSSLEKVHTLNLRGTGVTDVTSLAKVHTLKLKWTRVTDVTSLAKVHTLNLWGCHKITDVSALGNVHTLNLRGCDGVTDVSMLGNVHTLNLSECDGVTDVSMLGNVYNLDLSHTDVIGLGALSGVHILKLKGCYNLNIFELGYVPPEYADSDEETKYAKWQTKIHHLDVSYTKSNPSYQLLNRIHTVTWNYARDNCNLESPGLDSNIHTLSMKHCSKLRNVNVFSNVHNLDLYGCKNVEDVSALGSVHNLNLGNCKKIKDVSILSNVHTLNLWGCDSVTDDNIIKLIKAKGFVLNNFMIGNELNRILAIAKLRNENKVWENFEEDSDGYDSDD